MDLRSKDGISVKPVLDIRRAKINGLYPVRICFIYRSVAKYLRTNADMSVEDWNQMVDNKPPHLLSIHQHVKERLDLVKGIVDTLSEKQMFSFDVLKTEFVKQTSPSYNAEREKESV